jgi:protein-S-isoprenylcysteine O-methyltransferase Ste14
MTIIVSIAGTLAFLGIGVAGWGDLGGYLAHPARAAAAAYVVLLTVVALFSGVNFGHGTREDVKARWIFVPAALGSLALAWFPAFMDRRDLWTIDGDAARWLGLGLLVAGGVLRVWPMFVLGRRFSAFVAIQEGHALVTDGIYRHVRHPSFLGMLVAWAGWALVFRSSVGVLLLVPAIPVLLARIDAEEALLASEFPAYAEYRRRSWRLVPGVY